MSLHYTDGYIPSGLFRRQISLCKGYSIYIPHAGIPHHIRLSAERLQTRTRIRAPHDMDLHTIRHNGSRIHHCLRLHACKRRNRGNRQPLRMVVNPDDTVCTHRSILVSAHACNLQYRTLPGIQDGPKIVSNLSPDTVRNSTLCSFAGRKRHKHRQRTLYTGRSCTKTDRNTIYQGFHAFAMVHPCYNCDVLRPYTFKQKHSGWSYHNMAGHKFHAVDMGKNRLCNKKNMLYNRQKHSNNPGILACIHHAGQSISEILRL